MINDSELDYALLFIIEYWLFAVDTVGKNFQFSYYDEPDDNEHGNRKR